MSEKESNGPDATGAEDILREIFGDGKAERIEADVAGEEMAQSILHITVPFTALAQTQYIGLSQAGMDPNLAAAVALKTYDMCLGIIGHYLRRLV